MQLTVFILILIIIAVSIFGSKLEKKVLEEESYNTVDSLFEQEWNGINNDELSAWYRVRARIKTMPKISKSEQKAYLNALSTRINQCRARNTHWMTVHRENNKLTTISTQN